MAEYETTGNTYEENPETDQTITLGLPRVEVRLDDPFLGFLAELDVDVKYEDGTGETLTTDENGIVELVKEKGAYADLTFETELREHTMRVFLDPGDVSTPEGAWKRLVNLGVVEDPEAPPEAPDEDALARAIETFQMERGIAVTGSLDSATVSALQSYPDSGEAWGQETVAQLETEHEGLTGDDCKEAVA